VKRFLEKQEYIRRHPDKKTIKHESHPKSADDIKNIGKNTRELLLKNLARNKG
jgi:hypothetical protein